MNRRCSKCHIFKPLDCFHNDKYAPLGKSLRCKTCAIAKSRSYFLENHEVQTARQRAWHHANKKKANATSKAYRESHRAEVSAKKKEWYEANKHTQKERDRAKYLRRRKAVLKRCREYVKENKSRVLAAAKAYRESNKEAVSKIKLICYNRKRKTDPAFRVLCNLRTRLGAAVRGASKSAKTIELLGCEIAHLMIHLESQFTEGMTWENYGQWHIDHVKPCASFDFTEPAQQRACFHWTNLQPLWGIDNILKSDSTPAKSASACAPFPSPA